MKNLKNTLAATAMMVVLGVGAVSANTGIIITDRSTTGSTGCATGGVLQQLAGVYNALSGMLISDRDGIIITDKATPCSTGKDGMMITDRDGIIITD